MPITTATLGSTAQLFAPVVTVDVVGSACAAALPFDPVTRARSTRRRP